MGADGAAVNLGKKGGVVALLRKKVPHLLGFHCLIDFSKWYFSLFSLLCIQFDNIRSTDILSCVTKYERGLS